MSLYLVLLFLPPLPFPLHGARRSCGPISAQLERYESLGYKGPAILASCHRDSGSDAASNRLTTFAFYRRCEFRVLVFFVDRLRWRAMLFCFCFPSVEICRYTVETFSQKYCCRMLSYSLDFEQRKGKILKLWNLEQS